MAMKDQCKQAVAQALGKQSLTAQEAANIEARINETMRNMARRDVQKWRNLSDVERLTEASKQVAIDIQEQLARKNKIAFQDILTQSKNLAALDHPKLSASEVVDRMVANHGDMSGIQSINSKARAIAAIYRGDLVDFYTNVKGAAGIFTDAELVQKIVRERFGDSTGDPLAKKISDKMGDVFETMRERFNRNGGDIGKLDNWGMPQTHNLAKIAKAGKEAWVNKAESLIDTRQYVKENGDYYSQQEIRSLLEYTYDTLSTGGANKIEVGRQRAGGGTSKVTNRNAESRVLHFKDANAWLEYQNEFGGMQFVDLVEAHINGLSKDIAVVENLGSNPTTAFRILTDAADAKDRERKIVTTKGNSTLNRANIMFKEFMGENSPQSEVLANLGLAYRSLNVASLLGGTTIASIADQATIAKTAHVHGLSYRQTFGELVSQLNPANKADRELAHSLGLATEEMLGSIARWSDDGLTATHGKSEKLARISSALATQVLRVSGLNALTSASKVGFTKMLMNKYGTLSRTKAWDQLDAMDRELLSGTGLDERAWKIFQLAEPVIDRKGNQLMSARSIYEIPDDKLKAYGDPKRVKDEVASQLQAHLMDEQGMAVIEAGLRERTWFQVGGKGTATGEIFKGITQFKSFSAAFVLRQGSRTFSREGLKGKAAYGVPLFVTMTLLGGLVVQLRELLNGNDPLTILDSDDPKKTGAFFIRSVVAGGGLPVLGDILAAGMDTSGRDANSFIAGPMGSDFTTLLGLTIGNLTQYNEGRDTNFGNEAFRFAKGKIPAQNLWYTKAVINRMVFDNIQDTIAPGYREKALRKAEKKLDRSRYLGDFSWGGGFEDTRAPDFEKVVK